MGAGIALDIGWKSTRVVWGGGIKVVARGVWHVNERFKELSGVTEDVDQVRSRACVVDEGAQDAVYGDVIIPAKARTGCVDVLFGEYGTCLHTGLLCLHICLY